MAADRFDAVARALTQTRSRRTAVRVLSILLAAGLAGGAADSALAAMGLLGGEACTRGRQCQSGKCANGTCTCSGRVGCAQPGNPCRQASCDLETKRCQTADKAEGSSCDDGVACTTDACDGQGQCVGTPDDSRCAVAGQTCDQQQGCRCPTNRPTECANTCVDTQTDQNHCRQCNARCYPGETCAGGLCQASSCSENPPCTGDDVCDGGICHNPYGCSPADDVCQTGQEAPCPENAGGVCIGANGGQFCISNGFCLGLDQTCSDCPPGYDCATLNPDNLWCPCEGVTQRVCLLEQPPPSATLPTAATDTTPASELLGPQRRHRHRRR